MSSHAELPAVIAEIADVAGLDAAWALAYEKGGTTVFIPPKVTTNHWLVKLIGIEAAEKLSAHFRVMSGENRANGISLLIPMASDAQLAQRWEEVLSGDLSLTETARLMKVHERTVSRRRANHGWNRTGKQGSLF